MALQHLPQKEVHHTPTSVIQAANHLGDLTDYVEQHPETASKAVEFYRDCAMNQEFPLSIRAVCFSDYQYISENKLNLSRVDLEIDDKIKAIAATLSLH
jgi:hypothetical protein